MLDALLPYRRPPVSLLVLCWLPLSACAQDQPEPMPDTPPSSSSQMPAPYVFDQPDALFRLPDTLTEISGITVLDAQTLGAIQDEKGKLYLLDLNTGEIKDDPRFEKDGDYEDLTRVGNRLFILRSDGRLIEIEDWTADDFETNTHKTKLSKKYDTEGLMYDEANNRLLIACKEYAGKNLKDKKAIYAFDLATEELTDEPVFTIDIASVSDEAGPDSGPNAFIRDLLGDALDLSGFKPSALAIHPATNDVYVLSSVLKVIAVLQSDGDLRAVWPLPDRLFRQPEGMAFLPNGDLFIASEGDGRDAVLMRFSYHP